MTEHAQRTVALDHIRDNIARDGHHLYLIAGGADPRFAYTIGFRETLGIDLIFAGASFYLNDEVVIVVNDIALKLKAGGVKEDSTFEISSLGSFTLRKVHSTWSATLMLGALDFYQVTAVAALQIVPDEAHWTIDVPNLAEPWSVDSAPAWKWLHEAWAYPVPPKSAAITNIAALRGERITEAMRWEDDEWELVAGEGPNIPKDELRTCPLATLIAIDESLLAVVELPIGAGLWRDAISDWHPWGKKREAADAPAAQGSE